MYSKHKMTKLNFTIKLTLYKLAHKIILWDINDIDVHFLAWDLIQVFYRSHLLCDHGSHDSGLTKFTEFSSIFPHFSRIYRPQGKGNVFTGVCLSTISLMVTNSLLGLGTLRSVCILLECFLVFKVFFSTENLIHLSKLYTFHLNITKI